jgi:hypothetical protein
MISWVRRDAAHGFERGFNPVNRVIPVSPPLGRSDFFVCFRLPMTEELNASQFLVTIYPR